MSSCEADLQPVTLYGEFVRLEPLTINHTHALTLVGLQEELWRWSPTIVSTPEDMREYVLAALAEWQRGIALPFVIVDQTNNKAIGSTRYANIDIRNRRLEIGWTWITLPYQRTAANTEAKLALLTHAFEVLAVNRVELKTDVLNEKSRRAITRIGAVEEGVFRKHMIIYPSGRVRDTVYFSIIDSEWPAVKDRLLRLLRRHRDIVEPGPGEARRLQDSVYSDW